MERLVTANALDAQLASRASAGDDSAFTALVTRYQPAVFRPNSGISAITARGAPEELAKSRDLIREFEKDPGAACRNPATSLLKPADRFSVDQAQTGSKPAPAPDKVPAAPKKC